MAFALPLSKCTTSSTDTSPVYFYAWQYLALGVGSIRQASAHDLLLIVVFFAFIWPISFSIVAAVGRWTEGPISAVVIETLLSSGSMASLYWGRIGDLVLGGYLGLLALGLYLATCLTELSVRIVTRLVLGGTGNTPSTERP